MAKVEGCWANVLDDCEGELTGEHLISVAVWEPRTGGKDNREGKLAKQVTVRGGPGRTGPETLPIEDLVAHVLCRHHNNATHDLDEAAGNFRRAMHDYFATINARSDTKRRWPPHRATVHGPSLERWFMKTAITNAIKFDMPIGSPEAPPGRPTRELVEMVFGKRPVQRPIGLCAIQWVNNTMDFGEEFSFVYWDRNSTHIAGCLVRFRKFIFAVKLEAHDTPEEVFQRVLGQPRATVIQPLRGLKSHVNVELYVNWPDEPLRRRPRSKRDK